MFIFDIFQYAINMSCLLVSPIVCIFDNLAKVPRSADFSPLKNPVGSSSDCPETCCADICRLHKLYIEKNGGKVDASG